uniref:Uncharacterized protein n=1 Tax=Trichuris muris TaxID=70415 RepID=A0A5S6R4J4_TRIMR
MAMVPFRRRDQAARRRLAEPFNGGRPCRSDGRAAFSVVSRPCGTARAERTAPKRPEGKDGRQKAITISRRHCQQDGDNSDGGGGFFHFGPPEMGNSA